MPKIVDYDARRREIAANAVKVFVREGYFAANLSHVAELCGFGRTTIYKYFRNKDEIFSFVLDEVFGRLEEAAGRLVADSALSAEERLLGLLDLVVKEAIEDKEAVVLFLDLLLRMERMESSFQADIFRRVVSMKQSFERVLADGVASGELRPLNPAAMASVLFSLVEAYILRHSLFNSLQYDEAILATRILLEGLRKR